jgi:hypothetical protein
MKLLRWLGALLLTALLLACGGGGGSGDKSQAKTTMLVYMVASDLIPSAEGDLEAMLAASSSKDINVVLQVGGGSEAGIFPGVDLTQTARYRLAPVTEVQNGQGWKLERLPDADQPGATVPMNKSGSLQDFIQWGARQYPAQQYTLTLWNHGGGPIKGFGWDKSYGGGTQLSVKDITTALKQANVKMELIGFDACLMSSLEVAAALQPYANYLVASEEITYGWMWDDVLEFMVNNPLAKGNVLGKFIVDTYKMAHERHQDYTAYAVTDLQQVPALVAAFGKAASSLQESLQTGGLSTWMQIAAARRNAEDFQTNIFSTDYDLVDMLSWVNELTSRNLLSASTQKEIQAAFDRAVIHKDGGEDEAYGLMMYFPRYSTLDSEVLAQYNETEFSGPTKDLVQAYAAFASSAQIPQISVQTPVLSGTTFSAQISSSAPGLGRAFDRGFAVLTRNGEALAMQSVTVNGSEIRLPQAQMWGHLSGQVLTLLPENDEETVFMIPVWMLDGRNKRVPGMIYALKNDQGQLIARYKVTSSEAAGVGLAMLEIKPGDKFQAMSLGTDGKLSPTGITLVAPTGDWAVEMKNVQGSGYKIYAAASDLVGSLKVSSASVDLN